MTESHYSSIYDMTAQGPHRGTHPVVVIAPDESHWEMEAVKDLLRNGVGVTIFQVPVSG